ncbi:MAG: CAAX prenyl protease-related protein [Pirellulales bacterium]|nr:CAAX prenyl protease-related protein [Pirellulales bacterium]
MTNSPRTTLLEKHRWLPFLLPFVVYMLVGALEPTSRDKPGGGAIGLAILYSFYPGIYTLKIALTIAAAIFVWPGLKTFPLKLTRWGIVAGLVGGPLWIGLCMIDWQYVAPLLNDLGGGWLVGAGERSAYNPLAELAGKPPYAWAFLAVRFLGLVAVVPIIEEFFLRGWLMRFVMERDWWEVPFGKLSALAVVVGTAVPMMTHAGELLAAAVWFSMITWLMARTRNIWDCIAAHALTNLILGLYVVATGTWRLM